MFIAFEGIDGVGKTLHISLLAKFLRKQGKRVKLFSYPDKEGTYAKILYDFLNKKIQLPPESQFLVFLADMAKDQGKIKDALDRGNYVLADRYIFSTIAYQLIPLERACGVVKDLHFIRPTIVIYLDVTPDVAIERMAKKRRFSRFEKDKEHLTLARIRYKTLADQNFLTEWKSFDTTKPIEEVAEEIKKLFSK